MKTIVQKYSLERNKVGEPIGEECVAVHRDEKAALLHLWGAMEKPPTGDGYKYLIAFPDGQIMPFDAAYKRAFGESPVYRDNKATLYPRLSLP